MSRSYVFSSESVSEGHPDKVCDAISDAFLDACLNIDTMSRVACEVYAKSNIVLIGGEVTIPKLEGMPLDSVINVGQIVRDTIRNIGYIHDDDVFHANRVFIQNVITSQSPDIAQGVDSCKVDGKITDEQGAGDQGLMFGYACDETPELMPAPIMYAHRLCRSLAEYRKEGDEKWLRPDSKTQVSVEYIDGKATSITNIVISTQHVSGMDRRKIRDFCIDHVIRRVIPESMLTDKTEYWINPTGRFVIGGPHGDTGLTGRKVIVDTYGGVGRHGGGAFSGKDPTKVDRSAAYMARYVAKHIVAAGFAKKCEVQLAYVIGYPEPISIHIETFNTANIDESILEEAIRKTFLFKPAQIIDSLNLLRPIYLKTTNYGHFGKNDPNITWEKLDKVEILKNFVALLSSSC